MNNEATPRSKQKSPIELRNDLVRMIRVIAGSQGISVPAYVDSRLRPIAEAELPNVLEALAKNLSK